MRPDADIETADALALLSAAPSGSLTRRRFLQLVGLGAGAGLTGGALVEALAGSVPGLGALDESAFAAPVGAHEGILVVIGMYGGNDGLNTVVPIGDSNYYAQHGSLALQPAQTLPLSPSFGLHPALPELHRWWNAGQLAIVHGVGYPNPDLSHFNSMAIWMSGIRTGVPSSGWLGRWLDGQLSAADLYRAASIGTSVPLHLIGAEPWSRATAISPGKPAFGGGTSAADQRLYGALRAVAAPGGVGPWRDAVAGALRDQLDVAARLQPILPSTPPAGRLVAKLDAAARLINADLGFRVLEAGWGDFDSHANQPTMHPARMSELNAALQQFFAVLDPRWASRVAVMTFSEFGRTSYENDSDGTDHGTASCAFVLGANVRGGMYGSAPTLAGLKRWDRMAHTVDFRSYYASLLDGWLGGGSTQVLGATYEDLHLFARGPGQAGGTIPPPAAVSSGAASFVAMTPARIADTRDGTGGVPVRRLGPGEHLRVAVAGAGGVPASGAVAVVANVTAADVSEPTFITVCPGGTARPDTSNLNPRPGRATPNLVIMGLGPDGSIDVHNAVGETHCIVDVFGWFSPGSGDRFTPLAPARVLDTRDGTGAPAGALAGDGRIDLQVLGRGGVPAGGVRAVVLNVTVDQPSAEGFLTVGPGGEPVPATSNLNFARGQAVPNLVVCKLGAGGTVSITSSVASAHVIADVFGWFGDAGACLSTVAPARLLDTRDGTGTSPGAVGPGGEVVLQVTGRGGVPANATAVVLNVTAADGTDTSFVTVWPDGEAKPGTSNLNMVAGEACANLVVTMLGANGAVRLANANGSTSLIADVTGYFTA
jgi:uncharacterized protein (DUF1501 family)